MRDLGYSLETAIADLVDNSISAGASAVEVICDLSGKDPVVAILDDGRGMTGDELLDAMRHGTLNPRERRSATDLGRFGLGLKTASFSQCRSLTVASATPHGTVASEWNLDRIDEADEWLLSVYDEADIRALPYIERLDATGTLVLWRLLDRLAARNVRSLEGFFLQAPSFHDRTSRLSQSDRRESGGYLSCSCAEVIRKRSS